MTQFQHVLDCALKALWPSFAPVVEEALWGKAGQKLLLGRYVS